MGGRVEVICGSMFSGKTEELIRRLRRALIAQQAVKVFKPAMDTRFADKELVSHSEVRLMSETVQESGEILEKAKGAKVVGIDEAQFFDESVVEVANQMANEGKRVIIAGLDMDFMGIPFQPMDQLMAIAEYVTKVHAVCVRCGNIASYSHRISPSGERVVIGERDIYEALCRRCFYENHR